MKQKPLGLLRHVLTGASLSDGVNGPEAGGPGEQQEPGPGEERGPDR